MALLAMATATAFSPLATDRHKWKSRTARRSSSIVAMVAVKNDEDEPCIVDPLLPSERKRSPSDLGTLFRRFSKVAAPYWSSDDKSQARIRLVGVFALTLATTGISVGFNFLGRDFYNSLASKDQEQFTRQLLYYLGAFIAGIPVFVFRDYSRDTLSLRWRAWMTKYYLERYFENRSFYNIQSQSLVDNPDQRVVDDLNSFTATALGFSLALFNATIDLISFSGILYSIYPPLFGVLVVYSIGGTAISVALGKGLVDLNFMQEKREADFRYGLVRVRENTESIAFYQGETNEIQLLLERFRQTFDNYSQLLLASRNLQFFQSGYRYVIQVLPAAVVAPLYFTGKIDFGVINQSFSAFNHILGDFSLIIYQFQSLSSFSAVIDRLGEFSDILDAQVATEDLIGIKIFDYVEKDAKPLLLEVEELTLQTPQYTLVLIENLTFSISQGQNLLVMGASGSGKTSLLRAIAGLWKCGSGSIKRYFTGNSSKSNGSILLERTIEDILFLPQKPYMVLGTLKQQLLYPTWNVEEKEELDDGLLSQSSTRPKPRNAEPADDQLAEVLRQVKLGQLLTRCNGLDSFADWSSVLSLGEQQRLAFARMLLSKPRLALLDEATSALDEETEAHLYGVLKTSGISVISVGHRSTLRRFHTHLLRLDNKNDANSWSLENLEQCEQQTLGTN
ncbi:ABC transporter D family member 2, chloroplastic [Selaginella moellendorffii]|nr:ABC transporter D family member 2, chloroplastic [Selaginella moellendorffii]|eukprot:XP_002969260.2 ABC transporter D family member 2, chloroplastic [Selaginella moellendorffii]